MLNGLRARIDEKIFIPVTIMTSKTAKAMLPPSSQPSFKPWWSSSNQKKVHKRANKYVPNLEN